MLLYFNFHEHCLCLTVLWWSKEKQLSLLDYSKIRVLCSACKHLLENEQNKSRSELENRVARMEKLYEQKGWFLSLWSPIFHWIVNHICDLQPFRVSQQDTQGQKLFWSPASSTVSQPCGWLRWDKASLRWDGSVNEVGRVCWRMKKQK